MPTREIRLETAAFLDSTQAKALTALKREETKKIVDAFLATPFSGDVRHQRRIDLLATYEATGSF